MNDLFNKFISLIGLTNHSGSTAILIKLIIALLLSFSIFFILNKIVVLTIHHFSKHKKRKWDTVLYDTRFFSRILFVIPGILFNLFISNFIGEEVVVIHRLTDIWITISILIVLTTFLGGIERVYTTYEVSKNRPITVFIQIIKIVLYVITIITISSIIADKSPEKLLYGLGAFTAVLMLIFKDSILGFVAGVQLVSNKMIAIGDWVQMPDGNANGVVQEITLYTVKIQNWDMTISTVPTYQLISESFINWKGMQKSGGRRIKRDININIRSVHFLSSDEIESLKKSSFLNEYITDMLENLDGYKSTDGETNYFDTTHLTNLGLFRIYILSWLKANPLVNNDMTMMVRQLQPTATGIPLQIYCFSTIKEWVPYENVGSDIFDHIIAIAPLFYLEIFQYPTQFFNTGSLNNKPS